ncbi:hypothetical protein [Ferroacidibacillus organovorans]|uniref:Uncharacterized protein n=1 Tax=Ferroacidibacillus organovorans TaxID=1765683 RepID=A0A162SNA6_9BACL|nr:hypothetical protein [Ferroacidibacillus organovorans]KYP79998.1 hypothetical protein AYJ22_12990 [Ferroacidibacillus organovorans]OAG95449.1 hypothetical protein AYW79_00645 [Ferroacidibacillus organovorans]OPG17544.1 hypothetical protein B2M26_00850 [Ferroacidibacillus organovorans]
MQFVPSDLRTIKKALSVAVLKGETDEERRQFQHLLDQMTHVSEVVKDGFLYDYNDNRPL